MHFQTSLAVVAMTLAAAVKADFQVYATKFYDVTGAEGDRWMVFDGPPSCNDVNNVYRPLGDYGDVSGTPGVRCSGCDSGDITELEINGGDWGHFTIYKDRDYAISPKDNSASRGNCRPDTGDSFNDCTGVTTTTGERRFICTSDLTGIRAR